MPSNLALVLSHGKLVLQDTGALRAARFVLRSLTAWDTTTRWLHFIESQPALASAPFEVRRVLADKIHRPFARRGLSMAARTEMLINHYNILTPLVPLEFLKSIVAGKRSTLCALQGRDPTDSYIITLSREMLSQHQGELTLLMTDVATQVPLARLVANLVYNDKGQKVFLVNGLQGPGPEYKSDIVRVTRHLGGLRPKRAILEAACALARALDMADILAIGKRNHVSQTKAKWQQRVRADYDIFWEEFSPTPLPNGDYPLSLTLPRRNLEDVIPKKRKDWLKRQAYLDQISQDVEESMSRYRGKSQ